MLFNERYASILDKCVTSLTTWKTFIQENLKEQEYDVETTKLQDITRRYCEIDNNFQRAVETIKLVENAVSDPSQNYNIDAMYQENLLKQDIQDPTSNEIWQQICCDDVTVRVIKPKKQKNNEHYEEINDSVMCSSAFSAPIDPISKGVIQKPLRNRKCRHVYDSQSIYDYIRQSGRKARCPYVGCKNNSLAPDDLLVDSQLEQQISQFLAQQETESSGSDEDSE